MKTTNAIHAIHHNANRAKSIYLFKAATANITVAAVLESQLHLVLTEQDLELLRARNERYTSDRLSWHDIPRRAGHGYVSDSAAIWAQETGYNEEWN